jgi:RimJ/RimL family protein N-acetyltransferase
MATHLEGDLILHEGHRLYVRPIRGDDTDRLRAFHATLSPETIIFRFFYYLPRLERDFAERLTHVDYTRRMALVATESSDANAPILGVARYAWIAPGMAEVAFVVEDHWQGHGIATALLRLLAAYARDLGYKKFVAVTMPSNARMLDVLRNCGFPYSRDYKDGDIIVTLDITSPPAGPYADLPRNAVKPAGESLPYPSSS